MFDVKQLEQFPNQPGVYLMKDEKDKVIYVGKANQLKNRIKQYFAVSGDSRPIIPFLRRHIASIHTIVVPSEKEALLLENTLIKKHQPKFNAVLKDDKSFISLTINTSHPWPMIQLIRYKRAQQNQNLYFGPYTSASAARQTYELLTRLFPLRQCSDTELKRRTRPCLLYSLKRCIAPCVNKCTPEEYRQLVDGAIKFLKGQDKAVLKNLYHDMHTCAERLEYERAAAILQTIRQIEHVVQSHSLVVQEKGKNSDALALFRQGQEVLLMQLFFREGNLVGSEHYSFSHILEDNAHILSSFILQYYPYQESPPEEILVPHPLPDAPLLSEILTEALQKRVVVLHPKKGNKRALVSIAEQNAQATFQKEQDTQAIRETMLLDMQETLQLNRYPKRIDCFDTSHISGTDPVASMVSFIDGIKDRKRMRLFKIKSASTGDDYAAMREALLRHFARTKDVDDLPDLIIVDGGKGQLSLALEVLKELDIASVDVIGLAKEEHRHDKGMTADRIFLAEQREPIQLNPRSSLLFLLQTIRDEAHRTAIAFHQHRRKKRVITSAIDKIPGIGPKKRACLLQHFGSLDKIRRATPQELALVKGISQKDIAQLLHFFLS